MMRINELTSVYEKEINDLMAIGLPYKKINNLLRRVGCKIEYGIVDGEIVALCATCEFKEFVFVEHLIVRKNRRGRGNGNKMLRCIQRCKPVLIQVKHLEDLGFYERLNYLLVGRTTIQGESVLLMSNDYYYCINNMELIKKNINKNSFIG